MRNNELTNPKHYKFESDIKLDIKKYFSSNWTDCLLNFIFLIKMIFHETYFFPPNTTSISKCEKIKSNLYASIPVIIINFLISICPIFPSIRYHRIKVKKRGYTPGVASHSAQERKSLQRNPELDPIKLLSLTAPEFLPFFFFNCRLLLKW